MKGNIMNKNTDEKNNRDLNKKAFKDILIDEKKKENKPIFLSEKEILNLDLRELHVKRLNSK
jgi:hypothetical protein